LVTAGLALCLGWYVDRTNVSNRALAQLAALHATHSYLLTIKGTPGVRLQVTVVTKPTRKETQIVTVPFELSIPAVEARVWVEILPGGGSGGDGDTYEIALAKDGVVDKMCAGRIQKSPGATDYQNGNAVWQLGDP